MGWIIHWDPWETLRFLPRGQGCHLRGWDPLFSRVHSSLGLQKAGEGAEGACGLQCCSGTEKHSGQPLALPRPRPGDEGAIGTCVPGTG